MIVLVCGGRTFNDRELLFGALDDLHRKMRLTEIIHGDTGGADALAGRWARGRGIYERVFKADWEKYGKSAGVIRNDRMLQNGRPALVVAFPGDRATADLVARTRKAGVPLMEVPPRAGHTAEENAGSRASAAQKTTSDVGVVTPRSVSRPPLRRRPPEK